MAKNTAKEETLQDEDIEETQEEQSIQPEMKTPEANRLQAKKIKSITIATAILIIAAALSLFFFIKTQSDQANLKNNPQALTKKQTEEIVSKVGKLVILPQGETPTVATITDPQKFKNQPFFAQALKDDQILIYASAKEAILYRPSRNIVINMAPASVDPTKSSQVTSTGTLKNPRFAIYNGTNITGLAKKYQKEVEAKVQSSTVTTIGDAKNKDVIKTFVVALSGQDASPIAQTLEISSGSLPDGEQKPDADFLVILGSDKSNL